MLDVSTPKPTRTFVSFPRFRNRGFRILALVVACFQCFQIVKAEDERANEFFEREVRPILVRQCYECHSSDAEDPEAGLRLERRSDWQQGGDSGPAVVPGAPERSLLIRAVRYDDPDLRMPTTGRLPQREIDTLEEWVRRGANGPDDEPVPQNSRTGDELDLAARRMSHWVWQPYDRPVPPKVRDERWPANDLDRFILSRLESKDLQPALPAERHTWLRRITYDLVGLPPTRSEIEAFVSDTSPSAKTKVVDRLLGSVRFGECWAQHWLDLVRFAETKGHEQDMPLPHAWRYRDYVIRAFNTNVPYDQFVREHLAGDLIDPPRIDPETQTNQSIQGTGFWYFGEATHSPVDIRGDEAGRMENQLDVFGKTFLGMTVACARCHDHKFDAILAEDYYALCGYLQSSSYQLANVADPLGRRKVADQLSTLQAQQGAQLFALYSRTLDSRLNSFHTELEEAAQRRQDAPESAQQKTDRLSCLARELERARGDVRHPLYCIAVVGDDVRKQSENESAKVLARLQQQIGKRTDATQRDAIVRFSEVASPPAHDDWITSGHAFGNRPSAVGDLLLRPDGIHPLARVAVQPAASAGFASTKLTGMLRTRTFQVTGDSLWYRYRGEADVFLAVDSHRTVAGPLHGIVKQSIKSPDATVWFRHNVGDYRDHRVHVEFTPRGEFELLEVCFSSSPPKEAIHVNASVAEELEANPPATIADVATATLRAFHEALERARLCVAGNGSMSPDDAILINWLLEHGDLLPPGDPVEATAYLDAAKKYVELRQELEKRLPPPVWAIAMLDGSGEDEHVHLRGSYKRLAKQPTPRRFLAALDGEMQIPFGSGRAQLADRVVDPHNPLTARVLVNRVWSHLFGRGIVPTVDNLGVMGAQPTHSELLDYLAAEFVADGWNVKRVIRRIVLSKTYGMSSTPDPAAAAHDPDNQLVHSARVRRISAEAVRDAILSVAGELKTSSYGPSVPIHITDFMRHNRSPAQSGPRDGAGRRSIYIEVRRNAPSHFLSAFDKPTPFTTVGHRHVSNSGAQPLMLLNDPLVHDLAHKWADALTERFSDDDQALRDAYLSAFGRPATRHEAARLFEFLHDRTAESNSTESNVAATRRQAWREICMTLFNVKEFVFLQ